MNFSLTDEQDMLIEAAASALARLDTVGAARAALDGAPPLDTWPTAREAGWSGLLIGEQHGGAGLQPFDAMLVLEQCGRRLAGAGLLGHLPATLVLDRAARAGDERAAQALPGLASGDVRAAMVHARPPSGDGGWGDAPVVDAEGRVTGTVRFQPDAAGAGLLVVAAVDAEGDPRALLVEAGAPGLEVAEIVRYDGSRPLGDVALSATPAHVLANDGDAGAEAWHVTQALLAADALGVAETMLEMSVAYAKERHTFGRPIGAYQAVKQQIVEIMRHAGTARSLCFYAGFAAEARPQELALAAAAARFAGEQATDYGTRTCIAVHGGIGATWEHDAPFYWRRAQLSRLLLGGVAEAGDRVAEEIIAQARDHALQTTSTAQEAP